jgi:hypothetical protein
MAKDARYWYTVFTRGSIGQDILLANVPGFNSDDAILEFATYYSKDPLSRYTDKKQASRHLGWLREIYKARLAKKDGNPQGGPTRVKNLESIT